MRAKASLLALAFALASRLTVENPGPWPSFRGPSGSGVAAGTAPTLWDAVTGQGVLWKTPIAGLGHSSPIVTGDLVCMTSATSGKADALKVGLYGDIAPVIDDSPQRFRVHRLERKTGKVRFEVDAIQAVPKIKRHPKSSHASSTMAADGCAAIQTTVASVTGLPWAVTVPRRVAAAFSLRVTDSAGAAVVSAGAKPSARTPTATTASSALSRNDPSAPDFAIASARRFSPAMSLWARGSTVSCA